jgi:hypothetical protein
MLTILRPLSTSELLDRTFHLYKNHFVVFFTIVALPQLVLLGFKLPYLQSIYAVRRPGSLLLLTLPLSLLTVVCLGMSHAAIVHAVSNLHLGREATIGGSFGAVARSLLRYLWISLVVSLLIGLGFMLLFIPGILWTLKYSLTMPSAVLEGTGLSGSMSRSSELTDDDWGRIFSVYVLFTLLSWVVGTLVQFSLGLRLPWTHAHGPVIFHAKAYVLISVAAFLTQSLVGPLLTIALTLLYYDERVRKEGFDLQLMMANLESAAALGTAVVSAT